MPIVVNVDVMLARRKMRLNTLAELVGITAQNLSVLKTGKAKAIRFSTLERLCEVLECEPGDLLAYEQGAAETALRVNTQADSSPIDFAQGTE
jgi:putative transcriptional regulator